MIGLLLVLYPAQWRRRYGEEFRAVLESRPLGPFDVADVVLGALDARLALRFAETSSANGGHHSMLRIGGYGAIGGGALLAVGFIGANMNDGLAGLWFVVFGAGLIGILAALAGMSGFQAYREPRLAWAAFGIPAVGIVLTMAGTIGMALRGDEEFLGSFSGWEFWAVGLLTMLLGSILFAVATIRARVFSNRPAMALAISSGTILLLALGSMNAETLIGKVVMVLTIGAFGASWVALGVSALRRGPIRAAAPA
jgi:hypothetical protein